MARLGIAGVGRERASHGILFPVNANETFIDTIIIGRTERRKSELTAKSKESQVHCKCNEESFSE